MARARSEQPAYQYHISGQAKARLDGGDFYLGKHGTPESYAKYYSLLAEYNSNGKVAPAKEKKSVIHQREVPTLIKHITADFRHRVLPDYLHNEAHHGRFSALLDLLRFTPRHPKPKRSKPPTQHPSFSRSTGLSGIGLRT